MVSCQPRERVYHIGVSQCSEDLWRETVNNELVREASYFQNIYVEIRSVQDNSSDQIKDIQYFMERGVDLLVVSPNESDTLTPIITKVYQSGIPVILLDRKTSNDQYTAYIGGDNVQIGQMVGEYLYSVLRGKGNVVVIRGTMGSTADEERYSGFVEALKDPARNGIKIIAEEHANFIRHDAKNSMEHVLKTIGSSKKIDAVFAFNDQMAVGVREAYDEYAPERDIPFIIGIDALSGPGGGIGYIIDGTINASFLYPTGGDKVIDLARRILSDIDFEKENILNTAAVDNGNVRVIKLQRDQVEEQQRKVDVLNSRVSDSTMKLFRQRQMFLSSVALVVVSLLLLVVFIRLNRTQRKFNKKLNEQNQRIKNQVNELKNQKQQLLNLSKELEDATHSKLVFFTNISHEFKTPLTLINNPVNELLENSKMDSDMRESLERVRRNSSKLLRLITEILDFRSYENAKMKINYTMADFKDFIQNLSAMFYDMIKRRQIEFSLDVAAGDYLMPFDQVKLEKVFINLLSNAFKHVDLKGTIRISISQKVSDEGRDVVLSVFNSGSYIPEEETKNIFKRFYTLDGNQQGTGIGLALATSIVDAHGGTISVKSVKNDGTTFTVEIPIEDESVVNVGEDESYVPEYAKLKLATMIDEDDGDDIIGEMEYDGKPILLVIDDNVDMRHYIRDVLSSDYHVIQAQDGNKGVAKALKFKPAIILCDIMMPGKDGYEVCRILKSNQITENTPIILLTACSLEEQKTRGYECGADAYLQKPFNLKTLKVRIKNLVEKSRKISSIGNDWLIGESGRAINDANMAFLKDFKTYVEDHIDQEISIIDLADNLGYSKSKMYRILKEFTDYSPVDLVNLIRLRRAVVLMIREGKNISEAAFESGFTSPSYFSRTFLKYYKERPSDYIKRLTEG